MLTTYARFRGGRSAVPSPGDRAPPLTRLLPAGSPRAVEHPLGAAPDGGRRLVGQAASERFHRCREPAPVVRWVGMRWWRAWLAGLASSAALAALPGDASADALEREARCMALVAYAEAAGEGAEGMLAVMHVIRNRIIDQRFPDDACAVALEPGQFQPVAERPRLRQALRDPMAIEPIEALGGAAPGRAERLEAALTAARAVLSGPQALGDPSGGAVYFVNPTLMDRSKCPWFAGLERTAVIGSHVFMTHAARDGVRAVAALDCGNPDRAPLVASRPSREAPEELVLATLSTPALPAAPSSTKREAVGSQATANQLPIAPPSAQPIAPPAAQPVAVPGMQPVEAVTVRPIEPMMAEPVAPMSPVPQSSTPAVLTAEAASPGSSPASPATATPLATSSRPSEPLAVTVVAARAMPFEETAVLAVQPRRTASPAATAPAPAVSSAWIDAPPPRHRRKGNEPRPAMSEAVIQVASLVERPSRLGTSRAVAGQDSFEPRTALIERGRIATAGRGAR